MWVFFIVMFIGMSTQLRRMLCQVLQYDFHAFPSDALIAMHMPCNESNMFATKCMCHIKCTDSRCDNARSVCMKYQSSRGCKYMLMRTVGGGRVATLKRTPSSDELERFNISMYPTTKAAFDLQFGSSLVRPTDLHKRFTLTNVRDRALLGETTVDMLFQSVTSPTKLCPQVVPVHSNGRGEGLDDRKNRFLNKTIAVAALSYRTPRTLVNSMRSWNESGFLHLMNERVALLNDPLVVDRAIAAAHGFELKEPSHFEGAKTSRPNVFTIGAAFYHVLTLLRSDFVVFLENDFKIDSSLSVETIAQELLAAAGMLERGAEVVRLLSRKYQGCGTFKSCDHPHMNFRSADPLNRRRNWYAFYCKGHPVEAAASGSVSDCFSGPNYRCFTSWDSNWSLNAVMVKRDSMLHKMYTIRGQKKSIAQIGLAQYQNQDGFESSMLGAWQHWRVPICISYNGLFIHEEIETSA